MKIGPILHQQIVQLRWYALACFGLVMALPIEESIINLRDGDGFYASPLSLGIPLAAAPLLAGLIACGNVQTDLDEKRYLFWRSKPLRVTLFMAIKYIVGLFTVLVVIASPVLFTFISGWLADAKDMEHGFKAVVINSFLISIMAYSLCFLCNVLIRKTARAWLVGMALMCLVILTPFILPLQYKDVSSDFTAVVSAIFISIILGSAIIAAVIALIATIYNWHLKTNLKALMWTAASVIFLLMLLFSRQVANIKELDEKIVYQPYSNAIKNIDGRLLMECQPIQPLDSNPCNWSFENYYVTAENGQIQFETVDNEILRHRGAIFAPEREYEKGGHHYTQNVMGDVELMANENGLFLYSLYVDARREKHDRNRLLYEYAYLRCYQLTNTRPELVSEIDLTEFIEEPGLYPRCVMRRMGDKIAAVVNKSGIVVELTQDGHFKVIEKKRGQIARFPYGFDPQVKVLNISLIPLETISEEDRMRLSIDLYTYYDYNSRLFYSRIDKQGERYVFAVCSRNEIIRYNIISWDTEKIECHLKDYRSFTMLERMLGDTWYYDFGNFVKDGKLYCYDRRSLMVFDIRSDRIRKLGHYFRPQRIENIEVLDDGNIVLLMCDHRGKPHPVTGQRRGSLKLLENPE